MFFHFALKCAWSDAGYKAKCSSCPNTNPSCAQKAIHVTSKECWERHIFEKYEFGVGENKHINKTEKGKIVALVTKRPFSDHKNVFGVSCISEIEKAREFPEYPPFPACWSDMVHIEPSLTVVVPENIDLNFDAIYKTRWNQGLFRYLSQNQMLDLLLKLMFEMQKTKSSSEELVKLARLIGMSKT